MKKKWVVGVLVVAVVIALGVFLTGAWKHKTVKEEGKIALIHVDGVIVGGRGQGSIWGGESGGTDELIRQLHEARDDSSVKAIILRINSPGGSAPASQEVGEEVKKVRQSGKIIVTSMGDVAASGGYWIAALTDKIYANPATITGSIGVYMPYMNWEELMNKIGVKEEKIKSGQHKDMMSPERPMTDAERKIIQDMVNDMYEQFLQVVAEGRHMEVEQVRPLADGRVYTGRQALDVGLVDEMGNLYDAIDGTAVLAGIPGRPEIKEYGKESPLAFLFGKSESIGLEQLLTRVGRNGTGIPLPLLIWDHAR